MIVLHLPRSRKVLLLLSQAILPFPVAAVDAAGLGVARTPSRSATTHQEPNFAAQAAAAFHHRNPLSVQPDRRFVPSSGGRGWPIGFRRGLFLRQRQSDTAMLPQQSPRGRRWAESVAQPSESRSMPSAAASYSSSLSPSKQTLEEMGKKATGKVLEVEQKFALLSESSTAPSADVLSSESVEERLRRAGFVLESTGAMIDWYYDTPDHALVLQDCWLRYRQELEVGDQRWDAATEAAPPPLPATAAAEIPSATGGGWQLKRGRRPADGQPAQGATGAIASAAATAATVYEETEGLQAVALAYALAAVVPSGRRQDLSKDDGLSESSVVNALSPSSSAQPSSSAPAASTEDLIVLARIATRRSRWRYFEQAQENQSTGEDEERREGRREWHPYSRLAVDMDWTDFGHAVGEVEVLVDAGEGERRAQGIREAKELIERFLRDVIHHDPGRVAVPAASPVAAQGKLERYLARFRPTLYHALLEAGIMK